MEEGGVQVNHMDRNFKATFESIFRSMLPDADLLGKTFYLTFYLLLTDFLFVPSVSEDVDSTLVGFLGEHDAFRVRSLMDAQENLCRSKWTTGIVTLMLPAHGLIKFILRHGFRLFRFVETGLIKIGFQPVRRCASWRDSWRCGRFTDIDQYTLNGNHIGEERNDL